MTRPDPPIDWRLTTIDRWSGDGPTVVNGGPPSLTATVDYRSQSMAAIVDR
nr:hypothetical protein [Tanacetum cinerariifolium]